MPSVGPVSGRVGVCWRMVRAGGVTKARTGPNWADAGFSGGREEETGQGCHQSTVSVRNSPAHHTHPNVRPPPFFFIFLDALLPSFSLLSISQPGFTSLLLFSFPSALLTKRFTNPGWYIIYDRLLCDWFKQMHSGGEGGLWGGAMQKMEKGESEKGCVPGCSSFTKPPHGPRWIFPFSLHSEKPYIKRSLYSLYLQEEAPLLWGQSGWGRTMICLHMHAWSIFRGALTCIISSWWRDLTFIKHASGNGGCVCCKANFYGGNQIVCNV